MDSRRERAREMTMSQLQLQARLVDHYERRRARERLPPDEAYDDQELVVQVTDLYASDNAVTHHTDRFLVVVDPPVTAVLRRGLPFYLAVRFSRPLDTSVDSVHFVFELGSRPEVTSGTRHAIPVTSRPELAADKSTWDIRVHRQDSCVAIFQVRIPVKCPVGIWRCKILTSKVGGSRRAAREFIVEEDIYILFNPWCQDDGVYMADPEARLEAVNGDHGRVWTGTHRQPRGRHWVYGQYDDVALPAAVLLLERSCLDYARRASPVEVARAVCAVMQTVVRTGGRGVHPSALTGSVAVLEGCLLGQELEGPSWVSSAVLVTVLRGLGIPSRAVTAYVSAHGHLTPASYLTGDPPCGGRSPPWSCHVWVEGWMARPDLPSGHGGWQALDPSSAHVTGPTSVEGVRRGEVGLVYDTGLVYASVNGDLCHIRQDSDTNSFSETRPSRYRVGCKIVTDSFKTSESDNSFQDITKNYKNEEGSPWERLAVFNAIQGLPPPPKVYGTARREKSDEVAFELVEIDNVMFGQPFDAAVRVQNKGHGEHDICVTLSAFSVLNSGEKAHHIGTLVSSFVLQPNQRESLVLAVSPGMYVDKLVDHSLIKILAFTEVKGVCQGWSEEDDLQMIKPKLAIEVKGSARVGQECSVVFTFQNPLDVVLTHCVFSMEGSGLARPRLRSPRDVLPNELVTLTETFTPKLAGKRKINAAFTSRQLTEVVGSSGVEVAQ